MPDPKKLDQNIPPLVTATDLMEELDRRIERLPHHPVPSEGEE